MKISRIFLYSKLFNTLFRLSFIADIQYRANVIIKIFADMCWYSGQIAIFEVLYLHTHQIAGWSIYDARLLLGSLFLSDAIFMVIFSESMERFSEKVIRGELDLLLVKPVNSQFLMSCQRMSTAYMANIFISLIFLVLVNIYSSLGFSIWRFLGGLTLVFFSVLITYSFRIFFAMMAIVFSRVEALNYVWYQFYRFGTRPDQIYPNALRYVFLSVLPIAFMASVPARIFSGKGSIEYFIAGICVPLTLLFLVSQCWNKVIKRYSSASS
ncbi:MAG: ABC-2 family transporter protein [Proteobacteria bacterium]|nr:ABC-2 family transporter protein [Pseudomonadota bacterium]